MKAIIFVLGLIGFAPPPTAPPNAPSCLVWEEAARLGEAAVEALTSAFASTIDVDAVLVKIGRPAVKPLTSVLRHPSVEVRHRALRTLGAIADNQATEPILAVLRADDSWEVRQAAVTSLIAALRNPNEEVRWRAAYALE